MRFGATSVVARGMTNLTRILLIQKSSATLHLVFTPKKKPHECDESTWNLTMKERDTQNILRQCESTCRSLLSRAAVVDESEILNAEVSKTASAPSTPSRSRKILGGGSSNVIPASKMLASGYASVGRLATASDDGAAKNGDFEALALQSYKEIAKDARITLAKCQAKRISLHRTLENYARRCEGDAIIAKQICHRIHCKITTAKKPIISVRFARICCNRPCDDFSCSRKGLFLRI